MNITRALEDDMAEIFGGKVHPDIAPPNGLEVTEYRDTALQTGNTDLVSESAYFPANLVAEGDITEERR